MDSKHSFFQCLVLSISTHSLGMLTLRSRHLAAPKKSVEWHAPMLAHNIWGIPQAPQEHSPFALTHTLRGTQETRDL